MAVTFSSNYNGEVKDQILALMVLGNEAVEKGSVYVNDGVQDKISMPRISASTDPLTDRNEEPTTEADALTYNERTIEPLDAMFFDKFNPRTFENVWRQYQPSGPLADKVLNPELQAAMVGAVSKRVQQQIGKLIWQGDTTAGASSPLRFFDGFITLAAADSDVVDVPNVGVITASNIITILDDIEEAIPDALFEDPDMVYHMSTTDFRKYQEAVKDLTYKGQGPAERVPAIFRDRDIRYYSGLPENSIMVARATSDPFSNLQAAVDMVDDDKNVVIERWRPESELWFMKILFKMAVQIGWGEEVVLYQGS